MPRRAGAYTFAAIFAVESFVRALNSTVVSLQAYDILGSAQKVSVLSTSVSITVLAVTLMLPHVLGRLRRRWAYTFGVVLLMAASLALASHVLAGQAAGMLMRNVGAAITNISLSLYILDHIRRNDLARAEPLRLSLSTFSWMMGPATGVWLYVTFGPWGPQLAAIASASVLLVIFWYLRLSENVSAPPAGQPQEVRCDQQPQALHQPAAPEAGLAHRLRALVLLDHVLHLWAAAHRRSRASARRWAG